MTKIAAFALLLFTGCTDTQDLASTPVQVDVWTAQVPDQIQVDVSSVSTSNTNVADTSHCLTLSGSTTITANGVPGTLDDVGGLPFDADFCTVASFTLTLSPLPSVVDIVIDDGSKRLEIKLVRDSFTKFQITQCDAASCSAFN